MYVLSTIISICGASREASTTAAIIDSQSAREERERGKGLAGKDGVNDLP